MKKIFITISAAVCCLSLQAQNLNQTVSITNAYRTGAEGEEKQYLPVAIPDSLTRFDYKFDYSVFDTPYKGAFEFSPYSVKLVPDSSMPESRKLFVRAGAGYGLYPQLQAVWNPVRKEKFSMNVHQNLHGYFGRYRSVCTDIGKNSLLLFADQGYAGYDLAETFGLDGKFRSEKFNADFDVSYDGIFNKDDRTSGNNFNSVTVDAGVSSAYASSGRIRYRVNLNAGYATDAMDHSFGKVSLSQREAALTATVGPLISRNFNLSIDGGLKYVDYGDAAEFDYSYLGYMLAPHADFVLGPVALEAGVRIDGTDKLKLAPDVRASVLLAGKIKVSASVTGGTGFNTYADMRRANHWYSRVYSENLRNTFEQLNACIGFEGGIASRLQYGLKGGFAMVEDLPLWGVARSNSYNKLLPRMTFVGCNYAYVDLSLVWKSPRFDADGSLSFRKSNLGGNSPTFDLPLLSGNAKIAYNWNRRIFAGARIKASMESKAMLGDVPMKLPAYIDFGVFGEFKINRRFSVWVEGNNLFNEAIRITPIHVENGINGIVGVTFNL